MEDGAEMGGIAHKEVAVHVVKHVFDLSPVEDVSESFISSRTHENVPEKSCFHLRNSTVGALSDGHLTQWSDPQVYRRQCSCLEKKRGIRLKTSQTSSIVTKDRS